MAARSTSPDMTTVFHARPHGKFIETHNNLRRKKVHRANQGTDFLGGSFSNEENVVASIQFRRERQPQHLKDDFSSRTDNNNSNSNSVTRLIKRNQLSFSNTVISKPLPGTVQCLVDQIQV